MSSLQTPGASDGDQLNMRLSLLASVLFAAVVGQSSTPQSRPDFSGRWVLAIPAEGAGRAASGNMKAANELLVAQTATSITIEHPTKGGTYPRAATHRFESYGTVGSRGARSTTHIFWFGHQLIISETTTTPRDAEGRQRTYEYGEMWSLESDGQLSIEVSDGRSDAKAASGTLVYGRR